MTSSAGWTSLRVSLTGSGRGRKARNGMVNRTYRTRRVEYAQGRPSIPDTVPSKDLLHQEHVCSLVASWCACHNPAYWEKRVIEPLLPCRSFAEPEPGSD